MKVELKYSSSALGRDLVDCFNNHCEQINVDGMLTCTYDYMHTFLNLCLNTFANSQARIGIEKSVRIRDYIDIKVFMEKNFIDLDKVIQYADLYKIKDKLRFVFITTNYVFDSKIFDDNIIKQLDILRDNNYSYSYDDGSIVRWNKDIKEVIFADIKERQYWYENHIINDSIVIKMQTRIKS